tara:strand:+ start:3799 stop:4398 length:600 start_codon:yes stop_codon:yes gene_type:complete
MKFYIDDITKKVLKKFPHRVEDIVNSFDHNKIHAKNELVSRIKNLQSRGNLRNPIPRISIVGGWYGNILIPLLDEYKINYEKIDFYEIDEEAIKIAKNHFLFDIDNINFKLQDATKIEFSGNRHLIINTSAEHMNSLNIKSGILAVQSNDYTSVDDHTNCVNNVQELIDQYKFKLNKIWYKLTTEYDNKYNRFTVIGRI